jgi:hypothetical protein
MAAITFGILMAGLVSDRHLIQAIHRPASEILTPVTGVGYLRWQREGDVASSVASNHWGTGISHKDDTARS